MSCSCNKTSPSHFEASTASTYFTTDDSYWDNIPASSTLTLSRTSSKALTKTPQVSRIYECLIGDKGLMWTLHPPISALPRTTARRAQYR